MFTGIIEELGTVRALRTAAGGARLDVACQTVLTGTAVGDSISVNGCCLTVTDVTVTALGDGGFTADIMGETLARTALSGLSEGSPVNLERALRSDGRLGGHLVQGHVDGVGEVLAVEPQPTWTLLRCRLPQPLEPYVVQKGSITVDGVSLTVTDVAPGHFSVGLIPHTLAVTVLGQRAAGDAVNLEVDIVAKYVQRLLRAGMPTPYGQEA